MHAEVSGLIMCLSLKYSDRVYSNPQILQVSTDYMLIVIAAIIMHFKIFDYQGFKMRPVCESCIIVRDKKLFEQQTAKPGNWQLV